MILSLPLYTLAFIFGACIGSFLNVCIYRIPAAMSIVHPGSSCPNCNTMISFYDNIPILSYLVLMGKCRHCKTPISPRYPFVELLGAVSALACALTFGPTLHGLLIFFFLATLIVVTFIDLDYRIIPDVITLPGIPIFFLFSLAMPGISWLDSIIGILVGGGSLFSVAWVYHAITGREGMGGGDIKLLAMMGAVIGWKGILFTIFAASAVGTVVGLLTMVKSSKGMRLAIPFGPFLATGGVLYLFFGPAIIRWYVNLIR